MSEDRVKEFVVQMKEEFAKIPKNLSVEEYLDRADRCLSLAETFSREEDKFKSKKYELLSQKYKKLAFEKQHPELMKKEVSGMPAQAIIEEIPAETPIVRKSMWKKFLGIFSGKAVKVEVKDAKN